MLEELFAQYHQELVRWCQTMTGEISAAQDIVQEAFLRAMLHADLLETLSPSQRRSWLYRTVKHLYIDGFRRRRFETTAQFLPEMAILPHAHSRIEWEELLSALPNIEGTLFYLRYLQGYTSQQLGELFSLPPGTVRSKLSSARMHLRHLLEQI